jgi:acyl dehydratase
VAIERHFFEDVVPGEELVTPAMTITEAHVGLYQGVTGDTAVDSGNVPELLPLAMTTGLGWRVPRPPLAVKAFLSFEWEILEPVRVGDTIHSTSRSAMLRRMRDGGLVVKEHQIIDQRGRVVQRGRFTFLVEHRPKHP